ncbi:hypothetical protein JY651_17765 [Pyxidicoccus parkwayensis]|uniref:Uncharacterized protein n=1 Tax=Pyxidicoccus parkwayensis TaxID=2813578 RepID=A0ABX7P878_9BACT|nr:hypothetical protein [Pyxidicoccus parkwaysis]QSQ26660.1 hypothetical protein JY651_17765 [Pyxidicoccus parkwaysis]
MKTEVESKRSRVSAWGVVLGLVLCCGLATQAWAQSSPTLAVQVTTQPRTGAAGDMVVASVMDTGVRTGARVSVTLRILDASGAIVAQTTDVVSEGVPLRLTYRATSSAGLSAQVLVPLGSTRLSAAVLTLERWDPSLPLGWYEPFLCPITSDPYLPPGPITDCHVEYLDLRAR